MQIGDRYWRDLRGGREVHQLRLGVGFHGSFLDADNLREVERNVILGQVNGHRPGSRSDLRSHIPPLDARMRISGGDVVGEILLSKRSGAPRRVDQFLRARQGCRIGRRLQPSIVLIPGAQVEHERGQHKQGQHEDSHDDGYCAGLLA